MQTFQVKNLLKKHILQKQSSTEVLTGNSGIDFIILHKNKFERKKTIMKLAIIGAGNMGGAIAKGILKSGSVSKNDLYISDFSEDNLKAFSALGVNTFNNNSEAVKEADAVLLAVKPNIYPDVLAELSKVSGIEEKLIITIAPGFEIKKTKSFFKGDIKVVRAMPNTPAMVGEGMSVICHGDEVGQKEIEMAKCVFESVGKMAVLPEKLLDSVVALNGSSPAYVFMFIEAMADGAVRDGIPRKLAYEIAAQSVLGSAKMVLETKKHPAELKDMVCSPGGTTIEAVAALEENGLRNAVLKAMQACTKKAKEMN